MSAGEETPIPSVPAGAIADLVRAHRAKLQAIADIDTKRVEELATLNTLLISTNGSANALTRAEALERVHELTVKTLRGVTENDS